jgi:hypothetical protein
MTRMAGEVLSAIERARGNGELSAVDLLRRDPTPPGADPRDYLVEPGLWASQILPFGVSIDQAIRDGVWRGPR